MRAIAPHVPRRRRGDEGFTLIELCVAMLIFSVMAALAVYPLRTWMAGERQGSTTSAVEAALREAQQRAITEGRSMCVSFNLGTQTYTFLRGACGTAGQVTLDGPVKPDTGVRFTAATFAAPAGGTTTGVTFYPRGTASPGTVQISRSGSTRVDTLTVEGLTGRVSLA
jgi:prepilin-type N-terminal cleavage/methylation domain-containing protein